MVYFIPIFLFLFVLCAAVGRLSSDYLIRHRQCRLWTFQGLSQVEKKLNPLLKKNKQALLLRTNERMVYVQWAAALATKNLLRAAYFQKQWSKIRKARKTLDQWQRSEIQNMQLELKLAQSRVRKMKATRLQISNPSLQLLPDSADIAPQYFPSPQFQTAITMNVNYHFQLEESLPSRLWPLLYRSLDYRFRGKIYGSCAATLNQVGPAWHVRLAPIPMGPS